MTTTTSGVFNTLNSSTTSGKITAGNNSVIVSSIEQLDITGTSYSDTITGGNGDDYFKGGSGGNDNLSGGAGNDQLSVTGGSAFSDTLLRGNGG